MFEKGITLEILRRVRELVSSYDENITIQQVYEKFFKVWTQSSQLSFLDSFHEQKIHPELKISDEDSIGAHPPNLFICHTAWSNNFLNFCSLIEDYCLKLQSDSVDTNGDHQPAEIILWLDLFCINYWDSHDRDSHFFGSILPEGLLKIGRTVLILPSVPSDKTSFSSACLWEIFLTSFHLLEFDIVGSKESLHLFQENLQHDRISVNISSSASEDDDEKVKILHLIDQFYQRHLQQPQEMVETGPVASVEWFNRNVHSAFVEWNRNQQAAEKAAAEMAPVTNAPEDEEDIPVCVNNQLELLSIEGRTATASQSEIRPKEDDTEDFLAATLELNSPSFSQLEGTIIEMGKESLIMFTCPYEECQGTITVAPNQINCGVFRHGVYKATGRPVGAHLSQDKCLELVRQGKVYGCVQPFRIRKIPKPSLCKLILETVVGVTADSVTTDKDGSIEEANELHVAVSGKETHSGKKNKKNQKPKQQQPKKEFRYFIEKCGYI
jgi:hypothetical protein